MNYGGFFVEKGRIFMVFAPAERLLKYNLKP